MSYQLTQTVAEIVTADYRTADVFKRHGIDFCCGGKVSLQDVCSKKRLNSDLLLSELEQTTASAPPADDVNEWQAGQLAQYIVETHHRYVTENAPLILQYAAKVARVYGERYPETVQVARLFELVSEELAHHMQKEEVILFPYVVQLIDAQRRGVAANRPHFGSVKNPIRMMEAEHENAGNLLHQIAELTNHYTPPADACNTFRVLYAKLWDFEADLHRHVHLENNILFPKAKELEQEVAAMVV